VFLDAGNTLLQIDYSVLAQVVSEAEPGVQPEMLRVAEWAARPRLDAALGHAWPAKAPAAAHRTSTESLEVFRQFMTMIFEEADINLPPEALDRALDELQDYHRAHNLWGRAHPFAARVLADLKQLGVKLAVVSNSGGDLEALLDRHQLRGNLDAVLDSSVVRLEKPDPRIFLLAAERLGVDPSEAVHVGDLYGVDVMGARAAGVEPVLIDPANLWPQTDCTKIRDLTALPDLVRRARSGPASIGGRSNIG
jgi:putative hydrolase of the HAD superfamily